MASPTLHVYVLSIFRRTWIGLSYLRLNLQSAVSPYSLILISWILYIVFLCISVPSMRISGAIHGCCSRMLCATLCAAATRCFVLTCKHAQKLRVIVRLVYFVLFCYIVCSIVRLFVQFYVKLVQRVSFLGISLVKIVFLVACHIVLNNLYQVFVLANKI